MDRRRYFLSLFFSLLSLPCSRSFREKPVHAFPRCAACNLKTFCFPFKSAVAPFHHFSPFFFHFFFLFVSLFLFLSSFLTELLIIIFFSVFFFFPLSGDAYSCPRPGHPSSHRRNARKIQNLNLLDKISSFSPSSDFFFLTPYIYIYNIYNIFIHVFFYIYNIYY